jgi:outer membrane protein TolC
MPLSAWDSVYLFSTGAKRRGEVKVAESNREVTESKLRQEQQTFNQNVFLLVEHFNNQSKTTEALPAEADSIAQRRYKTSIETFMIGKINTLDLNNAQVNKDEARQKSITELFYYWYYFYQLAQSHFLGFHSEC